VKLAWKIKTLPSVEQDKELLLTIKELSRV
jgi:hypothetical protein